MTQKTERLRKISVRVCVLMHSTIIFNLFQFYLFMVDESLKVFRFKVARVAGVVVALVVLDPGGIYLAKYTSIPPPAGVRKLKRRKQRKLKLYICK